MAYADYCTCVIESVAFFMSCSRSTILDTYDANDPQVYLPEGRLSWTEHQRASLYLIIS